MTVERGTQERILAAAKAEFLEKGFKSASLRNIVKNAGVTTGALYGYYAGKEELFAAITGEVYDHLMSRYKAALRAFADLAPQEQLRHMGEAGRDCMEELLLYMYDHKTESRLILQCAQGTRCENLMDELVELELDATKKYREVLRGLGRSVPETDPRLEHILVTGMMNAYFEMVIHDMPLDDAMMYLQELNDFYTAGWQKIMGQ